MSKQAFQYSVAVEKYLFSLISYWSCYTLKTHSTLNKTNKK